MSSNLAEQSDAIAALVPPPTSPNQDITVEEPDSPASPEAALAATTADDDHPTQQEELQRQQKEETQKDSISKDNGKILIDSLQIEEETKNPSPSEELEIPDETVDPQPSSQPTTPTYSPGKTSFEKEPLLPESTSDTNNVDIPLQRANSAPADDSGADPQPAAVSASSRTKNNLKPTTSPNGRKGAKMTTSLEDITSLRLWKGIVAEFVGTLLLTLVGCGSCINLRGDDNVTSPIVQIALCFGLSVATIVWAIGHVSGGHINPAVTFAMLATRKISVVKAIFFVIFQLIGAVVGAGILFGLTPEADHANLGATLLGKNISPGQGFGVEIMITFVLVFTVFASCDGKRKDLNGSSPLTIGLSVTMCHLFAIDYTGSSMNTARSFGPAVVMGKWKNHWVYWAGPILGGVVAGILYDMLFAVNASLTKAKACLLSSGYDNDRYVAKKIKVRIIEEDPEYDDGQELDDKNGDPSEA